MAEKTLQERLRDRLIAVPKPGTEWRDPLPGEWIEAVIGGDHAAGDDAGVRYQSVMLFGGMQSSPKLRPHIYAVEPLCEEAANELDRLTAQLKEAREERDDVVAELQDYGVDQRLWGIEEILAFLRARAKLCKERDLCSMAPTELSHCGTERAVGELEGLLRQRDRAVALIRMTLAMHRDCLCRDRRAALEEFLAEVDADRRGKK